MNTVKQKRIKRERRHKRVKVKLTGTLDRPRISVFKANRHIYGQIIDDVKGQTLAAASSMELKSKGKKQDLALEVGKLLASKALEKKIKLVVFDRGGFKYHGRIKAMADGLRQGGLEF